MPSLNQRERAGIVALMAVGAGAAWLASGGKGAGSPGQAPFLADVPPESAPVVFLDGLDGAAAGYDGRGRNLFGYASRPRRADTAGGVANVGQPPVKAQAPASDPKVAGPVAATKPRPAVRRPALPGVDFHYIGYLGPVDGRIGVFQAGDELILARAGERLRQDFVVRGFGHEEVELGYADAALAGRSERLELDHAGARRAVAPKAANQRRRR